MIRLGKYWGYVFEDLESVFKDTNIDFYKYITNIGLEMDLSKKDQQKIYLHHFIKRLCDVLHRTSDGRVIFHIESFNICEIQSKMIKKIKSIFGLSIWVSPYTMRTFVDKLQRRDVDVTDKFEVWLETLKKPKSFRHIKKYLDKEGFTDLSDSYFQDIANKMAILC